jgi:salicylate hydroxylase
MPESLRIAVIGAGPGGLATTIHLRRLSSVKLSVYDQAKELREIGAVSSHIVWTPSMR